MSILGSINEFLAQIEIDPETTAIPQGADFHDSTRYCALRASLME